MKNFSKVFVLLTAMIMACAFIGCSNNSNSPSSSLPSVDASLGKLIAYGVYTGDPSQDVAVTITTQKQLNNAGTAWVDGNGTENVTISSGTFTHPSVGIEFTRSNSTPQAGVKAVFTGYIQYRLVTLTCKNDGTFTVQKQFN